MNQLRILLFALIAFAASAATSFAHASPPPDQPAQLEHQAHAYLGAVDATGAWQDPRFTGLPPIVNVFQVDVRWAEPLELEASTGCKLRAGHSPASAELSRLSVGTKVKLHALHVTGAGDRFYVWGRVDVAKPAALLEPYLRGTPPALAVRSAAARDPLHPAEVRPHLLEHRGRAHL